MENLSVWAVWLFYVGCAPFVVLGSIHLIYTLASRKFYPRDEQLAKTMQAVSPRISSETTMWKAWTGDPTRNKRTPC